tara:strand:+ start:210 stop:479 length:270 start_codon:yes stop_codon:yes gene_type:complete
MTAKEIKQYIEDLGHEPRHDVNALASAAEEVAYLYQSSTDAKQVIEFMLADKPIPTLYTHDYGFHTRSGRGLRELFKDNYNSYIRNHGD